MPSMTWKTLLIAATAAAVLPGLALAEESGGESLAVVGPVEGMAGYEPLHDMSSHAAIDLDVRDVEANVGKDWAAVKEVYQNGKFSIKSDSSIRTLAGFSTGVEGSSKEEEHYYKLGHSFWGRWDFSDAHIMAALDAQDREPFGKYETNAKAKTDAARAQMVKKLIAFTLVRDYAVHEAEAALLKYKAGDSATKAWDEWWAFYVGSQEDGSNEANEEEGVGHLPYVLAEKRASKFGTDMKTIPGGMKEPWNVGNGGTSKVNWDLMFVTHAGQRMLQAPGNEQKLENAMKCLRAVTIVPDIQGCMMYAYRASTPTEVSDDDLPKYQAEAYAFCSAVLPFLHDADPNAAAALHATVRIDSAERPDWSVVQAAFSAEKLNGMGVRCADVGALKTGYPASMHEECRDGAITNSMMDASECDRVMMPSSGAALRAGLMSLVAAVASLALLL